MIKGIELIQIELAIIIIMGWSGILIKLFQLWKEGKF